MVKLILVLVLNVFKTHMIVTIEERWTIDFRA